MSRVSLIRRLWFILLVSVVGTRAKSLVDSSYASRTLTNATLSGDNGAVTDNSRSNFIANEPSTETWTVSRPEDQDPIESSETIVYNRFKNPPDNDEEYSASDDDPEGPPDHVIPHSEHEAPRDVPTKPKYNVPGEWAKPSSHRGASTEDVPLKLLAQVRRTHTVRRLPRKKAIEVAETDEEKENAARLREVVRNSKVNTVYTEEGYEDSAYDHAGHSRDADFHEGYARKLHEQMNNRKKPKNDEDNDGEENRAKVKKHEKIDAEEFKDYDEDYRDNYETTTDYNRLLDGADSNVESVKDERKERVNPQLVAQAGIQRLQDDLEREAEDMEKGVEISKLGTVEASSNQEILAETQRNVDYGRRKEKRRSRSRKRKGLAPLTENSEDRGENHAEKLEEAQALQNDDVYVENYSTTSIPIDEDRTSTERGAQETTTLSQISENFANDPSELYRYEVDGNSSPYTEAIDFQRADESPTTVSYSQLFWDYFKTREDQLTTMQPSSILESTTLRPNLLQLSPFVANPNGLLPYPLHGEQITTPFPVIQSAILNPQKLAYAQTLTNADYLQNNGQSNQLTSVDETWQPVNAKETPTADHSQLLEASKDSQGIPFSDSERNWASQEESSKNFDNPFFDPSLTSFINRKPRYKMTIRHKPKKPMDSPNYQFPNLESTSNPINDTPSESPTAESVMLNDNYMKVLMHLKNEDSARHPRPSAPQKINFLSSDEDDTNGLTRMRPPLPRKANGAGYRNFHPRGPMENEAPQKQRHGHTNPRASSARPVSFPTGLQHPSPRKMHPMPAVDLLPPAPSLTSDYNRYKEANGYLTDAGNRPKQSRNVLRPFRRAAIGFDGARSIRGKRRERRSAGRGRGDETGGAVKVFGTVANNGASDRGEIERAAKNTTTERNSPRKARLGVEVGLVPDTRRLAEKKSRSYASDRGEGSIGSPSGGSVSGTGRESAGGYGDMDEDGGKSGNARSDLGSLMDGIEGGLVKQKRDVEEELEVRRGGMSHEELLEEAPRVTGDVIDEEINARFNENQGEEEDEGEGSEKMVEAEVPGFDYVEEFNEEDDSGNVTATEATLDLQKYPFYKNERLPTPSALKYAIDPKRIPRKTYGGMEFYNSRDAYRHCDEVEPSLKVLPEEEKPDADKGLNENSPRLRGLGDKLDCFKAKYFDDDPFDNPLFLEEEAEEPMPPLRLGTKEFASRIMLFPKEDDDYVVQKSSKRPENYNRQRKPDPAAARVQKSRRIRYKTYPRTVITRRPRVYRIRSSKTRYVRTRRPQKIIRRPVSSASEVSSLYTPYQSQVYEDVMGTIKNMANSYQVHETTTTPESEEVGVTDKESNEAKTNTSTNSTSRGQKDKDRVLINIVEHPNNNVDISIEGLMPPKYANRHRMAYKRDRIPRKDRTRVQVTQKPLTGPRVVNHRQKIRIYKRGVTDEGDIEESAEKSIEMTSLEKDIDRTDSLFDVQEHDSKLINEDLDDRFNSTTESINVPVRKDSTTPATFSKSPVAKGKSKAPKSVQAQKVVYTIRDRIRHSKPKGLIRKTGKFVNETKVEEDHRRKEPKYNYIKRRKPSNSGSTASETSSLNSTDQINWARPTVATVTATTTSGDIEVDDEELVKENREIQYFANNTQNGSSNSSKKLDNLSREGSPERSYDQASNKTGNAYAVHENINESVTTTQEPPELSRLKAFLNSDPPGYTKLSSEEFKKSLYPPNNSTKNFNASFDSINSKQSSEKEDDNASKSFHRSYFSDEESSEKIETNTKVQPSAESSEEATNASKESNSEEDRTFFNYEARPSSPAENYEDEKYDDLGPRVNKPAFFHPPFSFSSYSSSRPKASSEEYSKEAEGSDEGKGEYVFPWYRDKEDEKKEARNRYRSKPIDEYEYPWERRERMEREERRKKDRKRKRFTKSFDGEDDDEDTSLEKRYQRNNYPRGKYRFWNRMKADSSEEDTSDNVESNSEHRPIMRYSSRYNSKNATLPLDEKSMSIKSRSVEEISRSIKRVLDGDSEEKSSSRGRKPAGSYKNRGISRGMIVPEDVTLTPTRKDGRKETFRTSTANSTELVSDTGYLLKGGENKGQRNSSALTKGATDNSESRLSVSKTSPSEITNTTNELNSMGQSNKRRRRPLKNIVPVVETTTKSAVEANRSRRRQRPAVSTTVVVTPASPTSTTPAPRVVRRKQQKSVKDSMKNTVPKAESNLSDSDNSKTETSTFRSRMEHRSRVSKEKNNTEESRTNEKSIESTKDTTDQGLQVKGSRRKEKVNKHSDNQGKNTKDESTERKSVELGGEFYRDDPRRIEESREFEQTLPSIKDKDESFGFKDDSDFDRSVPDDHDKYDDEFGSILKPDNRLEDNLLGTVSDLLAKNSEIEANESNHNVTRQKENNETKSVKIELLQDRTKEGKKNDIKGDGKKRESNTRAKFIRDPEHRLYYYVERRK